MSKRIGILTSGGDCPGLNAAIRGVAKVVYENIKDVEFVFNYDKEKLKARLAKLSCGVAVLKIGAATEMERKEKKESRLC